MRKHLNSLHSPSGTLDGKILNPIIRYTYTSESLKTMLHLKAIVGIDLVGELSDFTISTQDFPRIEEGGDGSVEYGCIVTGKHRVLRFNMDTLNRGDKDLVIGDPSNPSVQAKFFVPERPELTEGLGFKFKEQPFFVYSLRNEYSGVKVSGYKEAFCFDGLDPMSCQNQGLAARGIKRDRYDSDMACQFVCIDDIPDGEYVLEATVNAPSINAAKTGKGNIFIEEDNYDNNTVAVRLQIRGDDVTKL